MTLPKNGSLLMERTWFSGAFGSELGEGGANPLFSPLAAGGPSAWWRARDYVSGSTLADQSGRGNTMTLVSSPTFNSAEGFFTLAPGHLSAADNNDLDFNTTEDFTVVVVWRPLAAAAAFQGPFSKANSNDGYGALWLASGGNQVLAQYITTTSGQSDSVATPTVVFQNVDAYQALRRGATVDAYYNGAISSIADNNRDATSAAPFLIGFGANGGTGPISMRFYGAAVFRRALSLAEIAIVGSYLRGL